MVPWLWQSRPAPKPHQKAASDGMGVSVPFAASVSAEAAPGGGAVPLYNDQRHMVMVPAPEADYWLGRGFSRTQGDPKEASSALSSALETFKQAWSECFTATIESGELDRSDDGKSHAQRDAWVQLERSYREAVQLLETAYPPKA